MMKPSIPYFQYYIKYGLIINITLGLPYYHYEYVLSTLAKLFQLLVSIPQHPRLTLTLSLVYCSLLDAKLKYKEKKTCYSSHITCTVFGFQKSKIIQ